ncbi:MAG: peptidoglycan-binding protein [Pseudomonadota bacterium]
MRLPLHLISLARNAQDDITAEGAFGVTARLLVAVIGIWLAFAPRAGAQQAIWIQIEARPDLQTALDRARTYAARFSDLNGFALGNGWYGLMLGPYSRGEAEARLRRLRATAAIPRDSFIVADRGLGRRFWPITAPTPAQPAQPIPFPPDAQEDTTRAEADETLAEARRSERTLSREERRALQTALQWEGFYSAAIDGAFGPGTRNAMADYQLSRGYEPTGVLTTRQRGALIDDYNTVFDALGLEIIVDEAAGIEIMAPISLVGFSKHEAPFARYDSRTDRQIRMLLISQTGDRATLNGLYDVMQTLEIVPLEGARSKTADSFVLTGQDASLHSYTYARLSRGQVKGFSLIYPPEEARLMTRVAQMMRDSLRSTGDAALRPPLGADVGRYRLDRLAGLEIRQPIQSRSGFYVDGTGMVLTTTDGLAQCTRITIDEEYDAELQVLDASLGIGLLKPRQSLAPIAFATFFDGAPRLRSDIAVSGYSFDGALGAPTLTYGMLTDVQGLQGEESIERLSVRTTPSDAGGPVFGPAGAVVGMLLPKNEGGRVLPPDVRFAADAVALKALLAARGITVAKDGRDGVMAAEDLTLLAADVTVLVSCWN